LVLIVSTVLMDSIIEFVKSLHSEEGIKQLVLSGGLIVLIGIIFAETGLLVGFFLPGDSLLITAGVIAAQKAGNGDPLLNIWTLNFALTAAAIIGDQVGFYLGRKTGNAIFSRPDSRFFKKKHAEAAHEFYVKHGGKAIVFARFVPIMRTFVPFIAGVAEMPYRNFVLWNIFGGIFWVTSLLWAGYALGLTPWARRLDKIIVIVIFISILPLIFGTVKAFLANRKK
jgi:membrane-associated protein